MDSLHRVEPCVLLEVVVDTAAGLRIACENGADRVELCAGLGMGGLTPSTGLMKMAADVSLPVRAMIRPRGGDFAYDIDELAIMHDDIYAAARCGLEGVVLGVTQGDGAIDQTALAGLVAHARAHGLRVAMHRAFDMAPDAMAAMETCIRLKIDTILTSGGANTAVAGQAGLAALVRAAAGRIEILAGGGITTDNAAAILASGVMSVHASCSRPAVAGSPKAQTFGYGGEKQTDARLVAGLRTLLNGQLPNSQLPISQLLERQP